MKTYIVNDLIEEFAKNAIIQGEATYNGDYKKGNKASNKLFKLGDIMEKDVDLAKEMLEFLLKHENVNVRIWASGKALDINYKADEAEQILMEIAKMPDIGILGLNAEMSLKVRKGK